MRRHWATLTTLATLALMGLTGCEGNESHASPSTPNVPIAGVAPVTSPATSGDLSVTTPTPTPNPANPTPTPRRPKPTPSTSRTVRLATWNIEWLNSREGEGKVPRKESQYAVLRRYASTIKAHAIALQEVDGPKAAERVFDPKLYDFHFTQRRSLQRVGLAYRKGMKVTKHPDLKALSLGGNLRYGADITLHLNDGKTPLRVLAVHLKSGCFSSPLDGPPHGRERADACQKLARQVPILRAWLDARKREGVAAVIMGDFNRRLNLPKDQVFDKLNKSERLASTTRGQRSMCWGGRYPEFIDHILLTPGAVPLWKDGTLRQHTYSRRDEREHRNALSDHCPISITLEL